MKTFVRHAAALLAIAALCQARSALAEDFHWIASDSQSTTLVGDQKVTTTEQSACSMCCPEASCCDPCKSFGVVGLFGFDSFKGVSDGYQPSNFGAVAGLNAGMLLPGGLGERGIAWQIGMTYGAYDWDGRQTYRPADSQQQIFVTTGFYRKAPEGRRLSFGIVYDWMINNAWGEYAINPTLGQWRGQVEYALNDMNGVGAYGCMRDRQSTISAVTNRPISQANLFWHHKFESGAQSWLWFGFPEQTRLTRHGSLGNWIIGANLEAPISDRMALFGNAQYMHPSAVASANTNASAESTWNVSAGIVWYFGGGARTSSLNGASWLPYLPVANNSTFLVDQDPL